MKHIIYFLIYILAALATTAVAFFVFVVFTTPDVNDIQSCLNTSMHNVYLCENNKSYTRLRDISPILRHAIIVSEDDAFYHHDGFSWRELKKSFAANLAQKKYKRGGSTITQQLAKNVFLTSEKSILRKLREAILTKQIEDLLSKDQILEKYLNIVEFGPGVLGVHAAAQKYFNKSPAELHLLEANFLAYLLPNPKVHSRTFSQGTLTPYARYRLLDLSYRLFRYKKATEDQYTAAKEYIDLFPWTTLGAESAARLGGVNISADTSYELDSSLPEEDISLEVIVEDPTPFEEPVENSTDDANSEEAFEP